MQADLDPDHRGFRVALVADALVNPAPGAPDAIPVLSEEGWGVIQLPPDWYGDEVAVPLLEQAAEAVEEFVRHGYDVVVVGDGHRGLAPALAAVGVSPPDALPGEPPDALRAALRRRPAPPAAAR